MTSRVAFNTQNTKSQNNQPPKQPKVARELGEMQKVWNRRKAPLISLPFSSTMKSLLAKTHSLIAQPL